MAINEQQHVAFEGQDNYSNYAWRKNKVSKMSKTSEQDLVKKRGKSAVARYVGRFFLVSSLSALFILCLVMIYAQMNKYFASQSTVAYNIDTTHDILDFPAVSICPGFKVDKVKELVWPIHVWDLLVFTENYDDTYPTTRAGMEELWDEITYSPSEILNFIGLDYHEDPKNATWAYHRPDDLLNKKIGCVSLDRHDTLTGKCYTITTWCKVKALKNLALTFNFTLMTEDIIPVSIHHPKAYLGNNANFFPGPVVYEYVNRDTMLDLMLSTKIKERKDLKVIVTEDEYYECVNEAFFKDIEKKLDHFCYFPYLRSMLGEFADSMKHCPNETALRNVFFMTLSPLYVLYRDHGCPKPEEETSYSVDRREHKQIVYMTEKSDLYITLANTDILHEVEYQLQDIYAMVATIGGSIGIFLGWSLYDLSKAMAQGIQKVF